MKCGGDFSHGMKTPAIITEFLQALRHNRPELAAGTSINSAVRCSWRRKCIHGITVQLTDGCRVQVRGKDFALGSEGNRNASGVRKSIGDFIDTPVRDP